MGASFEPVRVAMVGLGLYGGPYDCFMKGMDELTMLKVFDVRPEATARVSGEMGCAGAATFKEILEDPEIEGIIVNTPNDLHAEQTVQAAAHGKHAYVVKPMANSVAECKSMIEASRAAGTVAFVDHPMRRTGAVRLIKELLAEGALGQPLAVEATCSSGWGLSLTPDQWRWYRSKCPGGPLLQLGIHQIDIVVYLFGKVKTVTASLRRLATPAEVVDTTFSLYEFESGPSGCLHANYATGVPYSSLRIYGTAGNIHSDAAGATLHRAKEEPERLDVDKVEVIRETLVEFAGCVRGKAEQEVTPEGAMHAVAIVEAARLSSREGRAVNIEEMM